MRLKRNFKTARKIIILLILCLALIELTGCSKTVTINLIDKSDIVYMPKDVPYTPQKDGWFFSKGAVDEVMQVKIEKIKLD